MSMLNRNVLNQISDHWLIYHLVWMIFQYKWREGVGRPEKKVFYCHHNLKAENIFSMMPASFSNICEDVLINSKMHLHVLIHILINMLSFN